MIQFFNKLQDGKIQLDNYAFKEFLEYYNFFKHRPNDNSSFNFMIRDGIFVKPIDESHIKDFVLNHILDTNLGTDVFNLVTNRTSIFKRDFLSMLKTEEIKTLRDDRHTSYLFYKNGIVQVTKDGKELKSYEDFDVSVWKDQVLHRNYIATDHHNSEFREFVWKISGGFDKDSISSENDKFLYERAVDRYNSFQTAIGFLLHAYNSNATGKAIVLNDEIISDDPNGRSGKSLVSVAIGHMRRLNTLNGKEFDFKGNFPYSSVKNDCQVLLFDDVKRGFPFENLFSVITQGIELEHKGKDRIQLPIEDSPKVLITTNYVLKGRGGSHEARKFELELSSFFNANYTPIDYFGHLLFTDWSDLEWTKFDCYMIECLKKYLKHGLISYSTINLPIKRLQSDISIELFECIQSIKIGEWQKADEFYEAYLSSVSKRYMAKSKNLVTKHIKQYCEFHNYEYDSVTNNGVKRFAINEKKKPIVTKTPDTDIWDEIERKLDL